MIMKFKSFLMLAFVSMFAVAGMTSCSSDDDELIDEILEDDDDLIL